MSSKRWPRPTDRLFFFIQALLRYVPFTFGVHLRRALYRPFFKRWGRRITIHDSVIIKYPSEISVGNNVMINQFCFLVGLGGLELGDDCMIGAGSKLVTTSHAFGNTGMPMRLQGIESRRTVIDDDCWLGFNVVVTAGSRVGRGSILAAGTVVNGVDYPPFSVIGGVPSRLIRSRIKESD